VIGLCDIAYTLGAAAEDVARWCSGQGRPAELALALARNGARRFHRAEGQTQGELALRALRRLLAQGDVDPARIDVLVVCHTSPANSLPAPLGLAGGLRRDAGLRNALTLAVGQQQCVSPVHALRVMAQLFARRPSWQTGVLVCADTLPVEALRAIGDAGMQSDGASAVLVRRDGGSRLCGLHTSNQARPTPAIGADGRYDTDPNYLWALVTLVRQVARAAGLRPGDFTSVLPHNVNRPAWHQALDALRIPRERLFERNFERVGHAFGSDAAINLADSRALARPGHHLVVASGIGGTFGGFAVSTD
jgi:3-oxoacyl-[acyl-carrier-protein] synthase III